ncbi:MAG: group III truncated hemoglobin [Sphingomonadales bacterium]|nr:group III truncated hemoglobin [Sphingomonadales bacterium]
MTAHPHHENPNPTAAEVHAHAQAARARKQAEAEAIGIDTAFISNLVETFYARIRDDALLGPIFTAKITDWPAHLARMKLFWGSVLHNSGLYSGNPMVKHVALPGLDEAHFAHWLTLFYATLRDIERDSAATKLIGGRARMIADSLLTGIEMQRSGLAGSRAGEKLPEV